MSVKNRFKELRYTLNLSQKKNGRRYRHKLYYGPKL